ncbi:methyltransferase domain protein [Corynebacterium efficiens YS-314]|nr:class I SAM-dependent methyltransferase [Corynebacterium efficiens]EEW50024.1 methyltransferase domain protein [Corynebacterium efficiens YS-314]
MSQEVPGAYGARAESYHRLLGTADEVSPVEMDLITRWARTVEGRIIDAGAGSGRWTHVLHRMGLEVTGIDITPELVAIGRREYPGVDIAEGSMDALPAADGSLGGILAWYSLIHTPPEEMPDILAEFHRALHPGGSILLGYIDGAEVTTIQHPIAPTWSWPAAEMTHLLDDEGFRIIHSQHRQHAGTWPQATVIAVKKQ